MVAALPTPQELEFTQVLPAGQGRLGSDFVALSEILQFDAERNRAGRPNVSIFGKSPFEPRREFDAFVTVNQAQSVR